MDTNKFTIPSLPAIQHILEDLSETELIKCDQPINLSSDDEIKKAYYCHQYYKKLENDFHKQAAFSSELDELNKTLVVNINSMNAQIKTNEN